MKGYKKIAFIGLLSTWLIGCASSEMPTSKEYLLLDTSLVNAQTVSTESQPIQLMPVVVANYLAGNEIVLISQQGVVHRSQNNLWAEPLSAQLTRLTQQRLEKTLPSLTWFGGQRLPAYAIAQLNIDVDKFYADLEGKVHLSGRWQLISATGEIAASHTFTTQRRLASDGYTSLVQTLSSAWFDDVMTPMSKAIAEAL
ncbi:PqiC family protein [Marinomonas algarum]|uniref:PqiC family protein n=1 Tax=Marinomonas algarum TaxID=2883105 RepID=A0A9X1LCC4_9GAMM|nr:PqiC family protein [Marinomonas algarum]MCB5161352.1 PqiC family protein [Marinomonas algarum]